MTQEQERPKGNNVHQIDFGQKTWKDGKNAIFLKEETEIAIQEIKGQWSLSYVLIWVAVLTLSIGAWVAVGWVLGAHFG